MSAVKRHENELTDVTSDFQNGSDLGIPLLPRSTSDSSLLEPDRFRKNQSKASISGFSLSLTFSSVKQYCVTSQIQGT